MRMGPAWDYNEAFGECCGYPIDGWQRNGQSGPGAPMALGHSLWQRVQGQGCCCGGRGSLHGAFIQATGQRPCAHATSVLSAIHPAGPWGLWHDVQPLHAGCTLACTALSTASAACMHADHVLTSTPLRRLKGPCRRVWRVGHLP
jgi:hypothetical protein